MLAYEPRAGPAHDRAEHECHEDGVVEVPEDGDEVGNEVERCRQVERDEPDEELVPARDPWVAEKPPEEDGALRGERREVAGQASRGGQRTR